MRNRARFATLGAATLLAAIGLAAPAHAATVHPDTSGCAWTVTVDGSGVYPSPYPGTPIRIKKAGETVTGPLPCQAVAGGGYSWQKLFLAGGGYGYIWTGDVAFAGTY